MEQTHEGWFKRQEIKKITADWVKSSVRLTNREKELLKIISERKLVRRDHLEIISPSFRNEPSRTRLINRAIKKMYKKMVLDKVHEPSVFGQGNNPSVVAIDKAGSIILQKPHRPRIIRNSEMYRGKHFVKRRLPATYRHTNGINQLEVDTILLCEQNNFEIVHWQIEKPRNFHVNEEKHVLIPDVLMILKLGDVLLPAFIEYDTGSEGIRQKEPQVIKEKIVRYYYYKIMELWKEEEWAKQFTISEFPILLFVTEDDERMDFFNRVSESVKLKTLPIYYENYSKALNGLIEYIQNKNNSPE